MPDTQIATQRHSPDWIVLTIALIAQFMVVLDVSIVNVALPTMQRSLHFTLSNAQWVINAYVLTYAGFLLLGGRAADLFGRRRVYLSGLFVFVLASLGAGFAHNATQMIALRALQGVGAAILSPATLTIIVTTFQGPRMPKAIGAWSAVAGAGGAFGTIIGGLLTGYADWRWIFFINIPIGLGAAFLAMKFLQEMRKADDKDKLDVTGSVLITGGLASVIYAIVSSTEIGWGAKATIQWFIIGGLALIAFLVWEAKAATNPLVPFRIFKSRSLSVANIVMFLIGGVFFGFWYFLTFYFQAVLGYDAVKTGFSFLPMAVGIIIGAQISSRSIHKLGVRPVVFAGAIVSTLGFWWLSHITTTSHYFPGVIVPAVLCTFGIGLLFSPLATAATAQVDRADAGLASGILNTSRQIGGSLSLAIVGTLAASRSAELLQSNVSTNFALTAGYQRAYEISAIITLLGFVAAFFIPKTAGQHHQ